MSHGHDEKNGTKRRAEEAEHSHEVAVPKKLRDDTKVPHNELFLKLTASKPFFVFAGPCVIESLDHAMMMAKELKGIAERLNIALVFKSSFDKANRTDIHSFRGLGMEEGLEILRKVKEVYGLPIITDIHESHQAEQVAKVADVIQIPAFLCRQTDLLVAAAKTGKVIHIKKAQFASAQVVVKAAEKVAAAGNPNVMVCERGTTFGYGDLVVDPRNLVRMREGGFPVVADVTHSVQQPPSESGKLHSGGLREFVPCIARTAAAVGVDGFFFETHNDPDRALCDGPNQWPLRHFEAMLQELINISNASNGKRTDVYK